MGAPVIDYAVGTTGAFALSAAPSLLTNGLANLRLAMPLALIGSVTSIAGALVGLALPSDALQIALGVTILGIALLMWRAGRSEHPDVPRPDSLGAALGMHGVYHDPALGRDVAWQVHRTPAAFAAFAGIGILAGMFGLGAGWANVPALNLLLPQRAQELPDHVGHLVLKLARRSSPDAIEQEEERGGIGTGARCALAFPAFRRHRFASRMRSPARRPRSGHRWSSMRPARAGASASSSARRL